MHRSILAVDVALLVLSLGALMLVVLFGLKSEARAVPTVPDPYDVKAILSWPLAEADIDAVPPGAVSRQVRSADSHRLPLWQSYQLARMRFEQGDLAGSASA